VSSLVSDPSQNIESVYPLSPMQEGMLFHTLLRPTSGIYLMQNRYRLRGALNEGAFAEAWAQVVARHAMLRTSFVWKTQKRPLQVVHRQVELPFELLDLRELDDGQQEQRITAELTGELAQGFDLGRVPQRFRLIRLGEGRYELVHSFHHLLLDEWCTSLVMMDFLAHYRALAQGEIPVLPPARPYRDYINWLGRQDAAAAEAFWRRQLAGFSAPTPLGLPDRAQTTTGESNVDDAVERVDAAASAALGRLAQKLRVTLNTVVQAAWALALSRYSGEREVVFGVTVAGRPPELPGVESIVGLFINTLPLRVTVAPEQALGPFLVELLQQNLRLRQYEHTPLADVQRWSEVERGQPLFESLFVFENAPIDPALRAGDVFQVEHVRDRVHTNYPITIMAWPDTELGLKISYDRSRVSAEEARRLLGHLRSLLEGMARDPDARLGMLPLLTSHERKQVLVEWNDTGAGDERLTSYSALFQAQAERTPDAIAVSCDGRQLSYAELHRASNRMAHVLRGLGVGPDDRVVLLDERGIELLIAILAVFKAGAAYVPIEPSYPDERITCIMASSQPRALVTRQTLRARTERLGVPSVLVEDALAGTGPASDLTDAGCGRHLAYVIYTSGSTGVPKGAMVERAGMLNNMLSKVPRLGLGPGVVVAQTASPCFDISVWQFLAALLVGGVVDIVPDDTVRDPERLLAHVERRGTAVLELVPGMIQGLLDAAGERVRLPALRWLLPTGEVLPVALARAWLTRFPAIPLMNAYGPAECSDDVALHVIAAPPPLDEAQVPIGRPVDHLRLYVLDQLMAPLPVGVCGELYVGGLGVGRGYLGDARRSAAAFVPDPFAREPGARLYRTGDLGRWRADGSIEFSGRRDHQVKLRGFRIELGEVEARLAEHPAVREVAVVVRGERLLAYVAALEAPAADELRDWLRARVPGYMVPAAFVVLPALPRNLSGKIDRRALPAAELSDAPERVLPRTPTEQRVAAIWAEVLGVESVGAYDSFFELGGHSLLLTQVLARLRRAFEVEVPLRALFEEPTLEAHARAVDAAGACPEPHPPLRPFPREEAEPLSFAQERIWFLAQLDPDAAAYNVPAAVRMRGALDLARFKRALAQVVQRHELLRTRFIEVDGRAMMKVEAERRAEIQVLDLRELPEPQREPRVMEILTAHAARPFALGSDPLLRATLLRTAEREHVLLVVLHHIVSDGWSMNLLVEELTELYAADSEGREPALAPLPVQFADVARWQRQWLSGPVLEQQLAYWRQRLGTAAPVLRLPTDFQRPELRSDHGARQAFMLPSAISAELAALARASGVTSFMLLAAAFQALLSRYSGATDLRIGTPVAGRARVELEGLIGLFVNTVVLRADLGGDPRFVDLLERVRTDVVGAQAHQDVPFERLVQALRPARDPSHTPLFQVMFSLQEAPRRALAGAGLELQPLEVDAGGAQFELSLHLLADAGELSGSFEYSTDLFRAETVARMADDLRALLEAVAEQPSLRLSQLPEPQALSRAVLFAPGSNAPTPSDTNPDAATLPALAAIWAAVLGREQVAPSDNFFELGGDSILSLQVVSRARQAGLRITARHMFQYQTLAQLAQAASTAGPTAALATVTGEAPLLPIQRRFFARGLPNLHHWNQALLLALREPLDVPALESAVAALISHHDALRLRFLRRDEVWQQTYAPDEPTSLVHRVDLSRVPAAEQEAALTAQAARWQASLDLATGPVLRAVAFDLGGEQSRLLIFAHHLVVDGVSWRILLDDLHEAYERAQRRDAIVLPEKTSAFAHWGERLELAATSPAIIAEAATWLGLPWERVAPVPVDDPRGDATEAQLAVLSVGLSADDTKALLERVPAAYGTHIQEVLLTALALALGRFCDREVVAIEVEGHGREGLGDEAEELDFSRTVGWFTSAYPVVLEVSPASEPGDALRSVKEQLRRLPRRGLPFGIVRELGAGDVSERLRQLPEAQIGFNYLGQWDQMLGQGARFGLARESAGPEHDARSPLAYEIEIDAAVYDGRLDATLRYSSARYREPTVRGLAELWQRALERLIAHCVSPGAGAYTPSDFPDVALAHDELDALIAQLD
jgi:amino acid adenylation domain-containing protein/non-ribosomal peptide synthase protein (TIGR01720 family)